MKQTPILSLAIATFLTTATVHAQALAAEAAPTTPPAAAEAPKNTKPLSSTDTRALTQIATAMHFFMKMGETGKSKGKEKDPDVAAFGTAAHKEMVALWTPLATLAMDRKVENKYIPPEPDKGIKDDIAKLNKTKEDKWPAEYYELFAKDGKRYAAKVETTAKGISDPDLKKMGEAIAKLMAEQTANADAALKEAKKRK